MNDALLWLTVRHLENEVRDARLARSARNGQPPKRTSPFAAFFGRRPVAPTVEVAAPRLREA